MLSTITLKNTNVQEFRGKYFHFSRQIPNTRMTDI